jgi:hypothetical protein
VLFSHCQELNNKKIDIRNIEKMTIQKVDISIMTIVNVDCDKYEEFFNEKVKFALISDSTITNEFVGIINLLEPTNSNYSKFVDTRVKVKLFTKSETYIICIGQLSCSINNSNELFITSDLLLKFIEDIPANN